MAHSSYGKAGASVVSYGAFGASPLDWSETVAMIRTIQDPYKKVEVLKSRIRTLKKGPNFPGRDAVISDLEAQLRAANRLVAEDKKGQEHTSDWRDLGQTSAVLGQVLLAGGIIVTAALTYRLLRK
jgi:hypothetical protein